MKDIAIDYNIGSEVKQLRIRFTSQRTGQILMDKYYHGRAIFSQDLWRIYLADKSELNNSDDIATLIQILYEQNNGNIR